MRNIVAEQSRPRYPRAMCNLYSNTTAKEAMRRLFKVTSDLDHTGNAEPQEAIFPRYSATVLRLTASGKRELLHMHWGFLLPQVSAKTGKPILPKAVNNARDDKIQTSPFWRSSFEQRRCLVPASAYCEAKGLNPATYYWFGLASDDPDARPPFTFAGIWRQFKGDHRGEAVQIETYSIATTTPNELTRTIHPDRMPVILDPADHDKWLLGSVTEAATLLRPFPARQMRIVREGNAKADPLTIT